MNPRLALRWWLTAAAGLGLATACETAPLTALPPTAAGAPEASPTPVPPSATPVVPATLTLAPPTATLPPTATATGTPEAAVTPDPNRNLGATLWEERFDGVSGWNWTYTDEAATFSLADGQLNAVMKRNDLGWRISGGPDVQAGNQQIRLTARANLCYANDEYGLFFRGRLDDRGRFSGYLFKVNCGGQARLEQLLNNEQRVLLDWTTTPAIQAGAPAENTLLIWTAEDQIHLYVNDRYVGTAADNTYAEGEFGLFLRDRTNGGLSVSFTELIVKEVTAP